MPSLGMQGPYLFTIQSIDDHVEEKIGNYALGHAAQGQFVVNYVGRSDTNLNQRLKKHIGEGYTHFTFSYAGDPIQAYHKECQHYHCFTAQNHKLDNVVHPGKPEDHPEWLECYYCHL